jgi:hypothetical protein
MRVKGGDRVVNNINGAKSMVYSILLKYNIDLIKEKVKD